MLCLTFMFTTNTHSGVSKIAQVKQETVILSPVEYVDKYAEQYGVDSQVLKKVMFCESSNNPKAVNKKDPNGGSFGVMQFQIETFYSYAKKIKIENPDIHNVEQQIKVASYMFSIGQMKQWSCARNLGFV